MSMNGIDKYMIPLDSIQSAMACDIVGIIMAALSMGMLASFTAAFLTLVISNSEDAAAKVLGIVMIVTTVIAFCWTIGYGKSIDTSKINDEYGITVTSMSRPDNQDNAIESRHVSYLHDGAMVNGTLIVKDDKVALLAGKGDKLTPVKPKSVDDANDSPTTPKATDTSKPSETTHSRAGCYAKSYNKDGSIRELSGDCAGDVKGK
jgi:hypothetical protein